MEEIEKLIEGYEIFLKNTDGLLIQLRNGGLNPQFESAAKSIAGVEKQIRDVERILPSLRAFLPVKQANEGTPAGWTTDPDEADRKPR